MDMTPEKESHARLMLAHAEKVNAMNAMIQEEEQPLDEQPLPLSKIATALAKAQGEFEPITRDKTVTVVMKTGGRYTFSYAPLESILHAVTPALSANGLALTQALVFRNDKEYVETTLRHTSGEILQNYIPLFIKEDGPQAYGSALTYARRYGVTLLLCVAADNDEDGNGAEGNDATPEEQQRNAASKKQQADRATALANKFKEAHKTGLDGRIYEVHLEANADQELYGQAWRLISASVRSDIKAAIERVKVPNTNRENSNGN